MNERFDRAFARVLGVLAEIETLISNEGYPGAEARLPELEARLQRYLRVAQRAQSDEVHLQVGAFDALLARLELALGRHSREGVFQASADLREQVSAHFHARQPPPGPPGGSP